jgi:UDP-N-acetylmuramoyl-tripeptide--D-alanyl-D-alanine ligase
MFNKDFFYTTLTHAIFKSDTKNKITGFAIDSRLVKNNDVFIALAGEKVDGHDYIENALQNGAVALLVEKEKKDRLKSIEQKMLKNKLMIFVDDTLQALIMLAKAWRSHFSYPVVAITGSLGKTTTKEMVVSIGKAAQFPMVFSQKNQNTLLSLCLNILNMRYTHKLAVFEVGIDDVGQMEIKADILRPTIAVITNIAPSHTHFLGTMRNVACEKKKIFSFFGKKHTGIINGDQQLLSNDTYTHKVITFGCKKKNDIQARKVKLPNFMLKIHDKKRCVQLSVGHKGFVYNALAASAVAKTLNIDFDKIVQGLESFVSVERRFEKKQISKNRGIVISDCYNANPVSMKAALQSFDDMKCTGVKIAVLGDMKELGKKELFWHRQIGRFLQKNITVDILVLVGPLAKEIAKTIPADMKVYFTNDWQEATRTLKDLLGGTEDALVLVKGSLSMNLGCLVDNISI